ncbi:MAG: hypothetical protein IT350_04515 [Deltaproteobacteria bacterium]|nr:hypothetical protein [Deltaproteobacteria bacterium]
MTRRALFAAFVVFALLLVGCPEPKKMSYIDNGVIKIGVDLNMGGAITYLADYRNHDINLVNSADQGREIQPSYYSGPQPYGDPHPGWPDWPWNPIGAGDCYGNRSEVLEKFNDGTTIYVKSIPLQWALDNVPCECVFEQWIELDGNAARVHYKLTNNRADHTDYGARHQELPAVYTTDRFHRLFSYNGNAPFSGGPVEEIANSGPPWAYFGATEKWAALVQDNGWGLGVYNPDAEQFVGGFHGTPGSGDPTASSTGYLSPLRTENIRWNTVYEYDAFLILGYVEDIRAWVYENRP